MPLAVAKIKKVKLFSLLYFQSKVVLYRFSVNSSAHTIPRLIYNSPTGTRWLGTLGRAYPGPSTHLLIVHWVLQLSPVLKFQGLTRWVRKILISLSQDKDRVRP